MSRPTGYIVRPRDMKRLKYELNRVSTINGNLYDAARVLVGYAEPQQTQQTQLPPVHVVSLALPPSLPEWTPACNGNSKRPWFVARGHGLDFDRTPLAQRYLYRSDGNLRRFASVSAAQRVADRLNAAEVTS